MPRKILLVDQSKSIRRILRTMILANFNDAEVSEAEDNNEAMDILRADKLHVVLFSWESSTEQWLDFVKQTKSDPNSHNLNFIVFTSRPNEEHFQEAKQSGIEHRLVTPCTPETLTEIVNQACNPALLRQSRRYNVPGSTATLAQGVTTLDASIINISTGGMLCELGITKELDWTVPIMASINFTGVHNGIPLTANNLFAVMSSFFVQKRHPDHTPKTIRVAMRFLDLPAEALAQLNIVFNNAAALESDLN